MVEVEVSRVFRAPREKVFRTITDVENAPRVLPQYFKSIRVLKRDGDLLETDEEVEYGSRKIRQRARHRVIPPDRHEVEVVEGDTAGTRVVETYAEVPEGTKVNIKANIQLGGVAKLLGGLVKGKIEASMKELLDDFAKVVEG